MKRILSYLLICIYATIMIKPVMPTIADTFSHLLNYSEHITTVHHENGEYHVHYEYIEAAKKESGSESPNNIFKRAESASEHLMFTAFVYHSNLKERQVHTHLPDLCLPLNFLHQDLRPPIVPVA